MLKPVLDQFICKSICQIAWSSLSLITSKSCPEVCPALPQIVYIYIFIIFWIHGFSEKCCHLFWSGNSTCLLLWWQGGILLLAFRHLYLYTVVSNICWQIVSWLGPTTAHRLKGAFVVIHLFTSFFVFLVKLMCILVCFMNVFVEGYFEIIEYSFI